MNVRKETAQSEPKPIVHLINRTQTRNDKCFVFIEMKTLHFKMNNKPLYRKRELNIANLIWRMHSTVREYNTI